MNNDRFIYFDVGGVLLDYSQVFETPASEFNLKARDIFEVFNENSELITKGFLSSKQFWEKCIQKYNLNNADDYNFLESWVSDYQPIQEVHNLIYKIKPKYKIGILSNIYKGMLPLLLENEIIPNIHYKQIILSCDIGMMKPNPEIYALAQKRASVNPNNILLVDDNEKNIDGAKKAQWKTFLFNNKKRNQSANKLEEYLKHF